MTIKRQAIIAGAAAGSIFAAALFLGFSALPAQGQSVEAPVASIDPVRKVLHLRPSFGGDGVYRFRDEELRVTCWVAQYDSAAAITCIPDAARECPK